MDQASYKSSDSGAAGAVGTRKMNPYLQHMCMPENEMIPYVQISPEKFALNWFYLLCTLFKFKPLAACGFPKDEPEKVLE